MATELTYRPEESDAGPYLAVDALVTDCGRRFRNVAIVLDAGTENPLLTVSHPLGFRAVERIIADVREGKHEGR